MLLHLTLVEDRWISYIIPNRYAEWKDPNFETYQNITMLKDYAHKVENNTEKLLVTLQPKDKQRKITIPWGDKPNTQITVETAPRLLLGTRRQSTLLKTQKLLSMLFSLKP